MILKVANICKPLSLGPAPLEVEVGCGKGRFLTGRAAANPETTFLGIERMRERVNCFEAKCQRLKLANAHVLRLEALYTFWYLLPEHGIARTYVFFPDPWPKRKHHTHRLFGPLFLEALWHRLKTGGELQFATDHEEYFHVVEECFKRDDESRAAAGLARRYERITPMVRGPDAWTEFETLFRGQGLPIYAAAWKTLADLHAKALSPLTIAPEDEPREGVVRRQSRGKEWREAQKSEGE